MDNLCHSLAGAAIAQTGFARRLPRATVLGIIAANIPDVDAFVYFFGVDSATAVAFRRGWTHGLPALVAWSLLLASLFAWLARRWPPATAAPSHTEPRTFRARDFAALGAIAVCSHPVLDWMNTYGVRFLKPFSDQWFYGDTLFIVDPVLLTLFGAGWVVSSRMLARGNARSEWAARAALGVAILYIVAMKSLSVVTRKAASLEYGLEAPSARDLMVVPRPIAWLTRDVLVNSGDSYDRYSWGWELLRPVQVDNRSSTPTGADSATVALVRSTREGRNFLVWSRFPYFARDSASNSIFVGDLRYSSGTEESWAGIRVHPGATTNPAAR